MHPSLSFILKISERKTIATQIHDHLKTNDIVDNFQTNNDIVTTIGGGNGAMLVLRDLSAAFDTIDNEKYIGICENAQLFISLKCKQPLEVILKVNSCLSDIRRWMITNKLKINDSKTEFIVLRSPQLRCDLSSLSVNIGENQITQSSKVSELGVTFCQFLNFDDHITAICRSTYFPYCIPLLHIKRIDCGDSRINVHAY